MTTSLFKVERPSSASTARSAVAAGPSGSTYLAEGSNSSGEAMLSRINSDGTINWQKKITISGSSAAYGVTPSIASSTDHLAVVLRYSTDSGATFTSTVVLYDSSGTIIWQKVVPVSINRPPAVNATFANAGSTGVVVAEDESVYMTGMTNSDTKTNLLKLNGADGSLTWIVNLTSSTSAPTGDYLTELALMSGGDPVVSFWGADPTATGEYTHVQRITASTGAASWTRRIVWNNFADMGVGLAVDPSDNIYVATAYGAGTNVNIGKLDSSGTTSWLCEASIDGTSLEIASRMAADATGVYIQYNSATAFGHIFIPAAGTVASGNVKKSNYPKIYGTSSFEAHGGGISGSQMLASFSDRASGVAPIYTVVVRTESTNADDGTYGSLYARTTTSHDLSAPGTAAFSSPSYSRASAPSVTLSSGSITEASVSLTVTVLTGTYVATATGLASALAFGSAYVVGVELPYTISTAFGTARSGRGLYATGLASATAYGTPVARISYSATGTASTATFGTAALELDRISTTGGIASTAAFGEPRSTRGVWPYPIGHASSDAAATTFGTPAVALTANLSAAGLNATAFGTASAAYRLTTSALAAATAFGSAKVLLPLDVTAVATTLFGVPVTRALGYPSGFATTRVGAPSLRNRLNGAATGFTATTLGTPGSGGRSRTRGAKFRTQFGAPQAERTAP